MDHVLPPDEEPDPNERYFLGGDEDTIEAARRYMEKADATNAPDFFVVVLGERLVTVRDLRAHLARIAD